MNRTYSPIFRLTKNSVSSFISARLIYLFVVALIFGAGVFQISQIVSAQSEIKLQVAPLTPFRIGERLTYNISFEKFNNAAYAEIYAVSRGRLGEKDAVELRAKIKTTELVSAAFYLLDETRTTFASAENGLPLYVRRTSNAGVLPEEKINNYLVNPAANDDLLTLIYRIRNAGANGSFVFQEGERTFTVTVQNAVGSKRNPANQKLKTVAGEFDTILTTIQSDFFTERGLTNVQINFSNDEAKIPVLIRLQTPKGDFRAELASVQLIEPEIPAATTPTPTPAPAAKATPRPLVTPTPFIENQPLAAELPFVLGETLDYQVSTNGATAGILTLQAKERTQLSGQDSLVLTATVTGTQPQTILTLNDSITANVNPETLAPQQILFKLSGVFSQFNQQVLFDQKSGLAINNKAGQTEIPVGTHSLLSLAYAIRAINLKPSLDATNPINDTRVAVYLDNQAYVFTLRPANADFINLKGEKISAQLVSITTGNPNIDRLNLRIWLSNDKKRLPLRLMVGSHQADLIDEKLVAPK